jgi:PAS domain S-box-containing protein
MVGRPLVEFLVPEDRARAEANVSRMLQGELWGPDEYLGLRSDGSSFPLEANGDFIRGADGSPTSMIFIVRDMTERKLADEAQRERERAHDTLLGNLPGMAYRGANDRRWTMQFVSAGCEALTGHTPEAFVDDAVVTYGDLVWPADADKLWDDIQAAIAADAAWTCVYRITTATGELKWVWERGVAVKNDEGAQVLEGFIQDVTGQHEAETRLAAAAAEWRRTFDAMRDSVSVFDGEGRLLRCNRATTTLTGRDFEDLIGRPCYEVFHGSHGYHDACPQRRAVDSGRAETSLLEQGGVWLRVTFEPQIDAAGHVCGGVHVVSDVSELKESEQRLRASVARQERVTDGVIAALARSVEIRDPYTAGHERRVSELAAAIGRRLGLDEVTVKHVQVAGMLHDVGKIVVPAEILSKPGRLTATEFELIKGHPQAARSILESIEFDFPAADIILQHHERLDGSGYPAGRAGDEILLEARILAVADVAEAMISHRPYRAALPLHAAISELEDGAGTHYDAAACAAVVQLLGGDGFTFSE